MYIKHVDYIEKKERLFLERGVVVTIERQSSIYTTDLCALTYTTAASKLGQDISNLHIDVRYSIMDRRKNVH